MRVIEGYSSLVGLVLSRADEVEEMVRKRERGKEWVRRRNRWKLPVLPSPQSRLIALTRPVRRPAGVSRSKKRRLFNLLSLPKNVPVLRSRLLVGGILRSERRQETSSNSSRILSYATRGVCSARNLMVLRNSCDS